MHDPARLAAMLLADGYVIVDNAVPTELITALEAELAPRFVATPFCEGGFYGARTKRFGALLRRSRHIAGLVLHPIIRGIAETVLGEWCDRIVLNLTQAIEIHPGALAQVPHRDQDLWGGVKTGMHYQINVIWPIDPFTLESGATLVWPGSHHDAASQPGDARPVAAEMPPGSALLFLGSILHGAGANQSDHVRRAVITSYCLGWLRTFENQYLVYPPAIARAFDPDLAALIGYAQHRPNLGNVEGQCPSVLLHRDDIDGLPAIDALLPGQADMLDAYVAEQEAARAGLIGGERGVVGPGAALMTHDPNPEAGGGARTRIEADSSAVDGGATASSAAERARRAREHCPFLTTKQAAFHLGLAGDTLKKMRRERRGPPCRKHGTVWRYHIDDIEAWSRANMREGGNG